VPTDDTFSTVRSIKTSHQGSVQQKQTSPTPVVKHDSRKSSGREPTPIQPENIIQQPRIPISSPTPTDTKTNNVRNKETYTSVSIQPSQKRDKKTKTQGTEIDQQTPLKDMTKVADSSPSIYPDVASQKVSVKSLISQEEFDIEKGNEDEYFSVQTVAQEKNQKPEFGRKRLETDATRNVLASTPVYSEKISQLAQTSTNVSSVVDQDDTKETEDIHSSAFYIDKNVPTSHEIELNQNVLMELKYAKVDESSSLNDPNKTNQQDHIQSPVSFDMESQTSFSKGRTGSIHVPKDPTEQTQKREQMIAQTQLQMLPSDKLSVTSSAQEERMSQKIHPPVMAVSGPKDKQSFRKSPPKNDEFPPEQLAEAIVRKSREQPHLTFDVRKPQTLTTLKINRDMQRKEKVQELRIDVGEAGAKSLQRKLTEVATTTRGEKEAVRKNKENVGLGITPQRQSQPQTQRQDTLKHHIKSPIIQDLAPLSEPTTSASPPDGSSPITMISKSLKSSSMKTTSPFLGRTSPRLDRTQAVGGQKSIPPPSPVSDVSKTSGKSYVKPSAGKKTKKISNIDQHTSASLSTFESMGGKQYPEMPLRKSTTSKIFLFFYSIFYFRYYRI